MVSRRTRVAFWIFRRDHPSRPNAMICCFFSSFKTFAMLREATCCLAASMSRTFLLKVMAAFRVLMYGRFWESNEVWNNCPGSTSARFAAYAFILSRSLGTDLSQETIGRAME